MDTPLSPSGQPQSTEPPKQWTVGQLRAELIGLPDDTPVVVDIAIDVTGSTYERRPVIGAGYGPGIDPTEDIFTGQEFPLVAGHQAPGDVDLSWSGPDQPPVTDQGITPTGDDTA